MAETGLDPQLFLAHRRRLENPSASELRDAFTGLPKRGFIELVCAWERRLELQQTLERCGAFALSLEPQPGFRTVLLSAYKGKAGPCYETGRSVAYKGLAAAVLDDDSHLIAGTLRICEKTGGLHSLPPYHGLLTVSAANPDLWHQLETVPLPFDCNTFEADARQLAAVSAGAADSANPARGGNQVRVPAMYPGPFRLLILRDGAMLRRGVSYGLPQDQAKALAVRDRLVLLPPAMAAATTIPERFPEAFAARGPRCLLEDGIPTACAAVSATPDPATERQPENRVTPLSRTAKIALCAASLAMKERLQRLLTHREPYFILTGSDPADLNGCCPNDLVGEANRLTAAGVLARHPVPTGPDACTNTLFAFAGEITGTPDLPRFCIEEARRQQVAELLSETAAAAATQPLRTGLRIFLALLALASLSLAVHRTAQLAGACSGPEDMTGALTRVLHVSPRATVLIVCLFTGDRHCDNCGQLRSRGQAVLQRWFPEELATGLIQWREINLDAPVNRPLRPHVSGGATTLGLVRVSAGIPREVRLLTRQLWHLRDNEAAVAAMLRDEISQLLADRS